MRWFAILIGIVVWIGAIGASIYLNYVAGLDLDDGGDKGKAIGAINVAADLWKALCPVFLWVLWRNNRRPTAVLLSLSWIAALIYAMTNALGIVAERRGAWTEGREAARAAYESTRRDLAKAEEQRRTIPAHRSAREVQAAIDVVLARPVKDGDRIRGTVGSLSSKCERQASRTIEACAEVQALRTELASATEAQQLDGRIAQLKNQVAHLRERGGTLEADPNARLISRLSFGWIDVNDAPLLRLLLLALFIELVSAFLPVGLVEYAHATGRDVSRQVAAGPVAPRPVLVKRDAAVLDHQSAGAVIDYVTDRTEPAPETVAIAAIELHDDYETWCRDQNLAAMSLTSFVGAFDNIREHPDMAQKVRKFGTRYYGIRIAGKAIARLPSPKRRA